LIIERPCKPGADQIIEMLVMFAAANRSCGRQKFIHALSANLFSHASMKHFNRTIIDLTSNYPEAVAIATRFIAQPAQEFRALCWQSERDGNHLPREITPQTIFDVTFSPCGFQVFLSLCGVALVSTTFPIDE